MLKVIVFDLDETLIDSKDALLRYFRRLYEHVGEPFPVGREEYLYTAPEKGMLASLFCDPETLAAARKFRDAYPESDHITPIRLKRHAAETLAALAGSYRMGLATNRGPSTEGVLRHLNIRQYFEIVVMARTLARPKPDRVVMETILAHFGVTADEALMVGDSETDVKTAAAVGCRCCIVGVHAAEGLGDFQLADLSGLPELLRGL